MQKKIAIIPARSGSKGLRDKNILMLLNKPLMAYSIESAINSAMFDRVIVSTDSYEYKDIAEKYGAEVMIRSKELSSDTATTYMVIEDVINKINNFDYFVLLQPTSPFRNDIHIKEAITLFENNQKANFLVSVKESEKSSDLIKPIDNDLSLKFFESDYSSYRRQDEKEYTPNGAIFIANKNKYLEKKHFFGEDSIAYIMSKKDSIDIDDKLDFEFAITIAAQSKKKEILLKRIRDRINEKKHLMQQNYDPITFIGHSIFDYWPIKKINALKVSNLGIAGINTKQYLDHIIKKNLIKNFGDYVFIFSGTNDIVLENWKCKNTLDWINEISVFIRKNNPATKIYLISVPPVRGRIDRNNNLIRELNEYLRNNLKSVVFIELSNDFYDKYNNLNPYYTYDGLHFTQAGYEKLEKELEKYII
ncbi:acylneuraminate cytidylyltransferase [Xenorhabdus sp. DI]|uniref:cytidylyltransferase domain-containing protein n=1 Tax=Xenorhabdus doucetiae TaxID=351671 RepID=UPI00198995D7|nr:MULTISPECIES: GDSL-type esterase/lipase family protein [unclassified Xenorhabdus]MBD2785781.1 acylneuraminate cytidylyltransferase [Xenorhabdus sp. 3]MBD2789170.1 acylneuraminate cytidylyltransferase [Xenorhabdus sp. DI]